MFLRIGVFVIRRQLHRQTQCHTARNNRNFVNRISTRRHCRNQRVSRFVVRSIFLFLVGQDQGLALNAHQHFVLGHFKVGHQYEFAILACCPQSSFVGQAFEVRARESRCAARDDREIHVVGNRLFAGVHAKDFFAALHVRPRDNDSAVEAARPQQCWVQYVRPVGCGDQDHAFV